MIIKEEPDISRYLKMREGEMETGDCRLLYRLTEPVYFALTGQNEKLEELIREGMPVQGVSPQICRELAYPMYIHRQMPGKNERLFDIVLRQYLPEMEDRPIILQWRRLSWEEDRIRSACC